MTMSSRAPLILWGLLQACADTPIQLDIPIHAPPTRAKPPTDTSPQRELQQLAAVLTSDTKTLVTDVQKVLQAEISQNPEQWKQAIAAASGPLKKYALTASQKSAAQSVPVPTAPFSIPPAPSPEIFPPAELLPKQQAHAVLLRRSDARKEAADYYLVLAHTYTRPEITATGMKMTEEAFLWMKVDDFLWVARYRALIGDYQTAQKFVEKTRKLLTHAKIQNPSKKFAETLSSNLADTYHTEASRISLEEKKYLQAAHQMDHAITIPNLNREWQDRIQWHQGLYRYLAGDLKSPLVYWATLSKQTKDPEMQAKITFWRLCIEKTTGQHTAARQNYAALKAKDPLGFYTLAAEQRLQEPTHFPAFTLPAATLRARLDFYDPKSLGPLVESKTLRPALQKIEVLLRANLLRFAKYAAMDLAQLTQKTLRRTPTTVPSYVYLSRVLYNTGNYKEALILTEQLARDNPTFWQEWPEQVWLAFPPAFSSLYHAVATEMHLPITSLYALSRQESRFDPEAQSPAMAYGLMQLIEPTAIRVHGPFPATPPLAQQLLDPKTNLHVGGKYFHSLLTRYENSPFLAYAAYNAGEYAVDRWRQKRQHQDPFLWVDLIPFGETRKYVQNVWRNAMVYERLHPTTERKE